MRGGSANFALGIKMTKRYQIRTSDDKQYKDVIKLIRDKVPIYVLSEKRRMISTAEIPPTILQDIKDRGATVVQDFKFDPE